MSCLLVGASVLAEARDFLEECGASGKEGTALIAGTLAAGARRLVIPSQEAGTYPNSWVRVTPVGDLEIAAALDRGQRYLCRIHSHPGEAFHSPTDDANPVLTHDGAFSIVVPFFGLGLRHGLGACGVFQLKKERWRELEPGRRRDALIRAD